MKVPSFVYSRMVDLSRTIAPLEDRLIHYRTARVPVDDPPTDRWYITTSIEMGGHVGTHVEGPYTPSKTVRPSPTSMSSAFLARPSSSTLAMLRWASRFRRSNSQRAAEPGGSVRPGDIALFRFDWDLRATAGSYPPYPSTEALRWLVEAGIKLLGIDTPGLDIPGDRSLPNHHLLFAHGIP